MVSKDSIFKSINDAILSVKHGAMWYNLCDTLKEITDSKEEYRTLRDDIYQFRKETKKLDYERLILKGVNGTFMTTNGSQYSVSKSSEMEQFVKDSYDENNEQLLYMGHNHPFPDTVFMSNGDFSELSENGEKYSFSSGAEGIMIVKNTNHRHDNRLISDAEYSQIIVSNEIDSAFQEKYHEELYQIQKEINNLTMGSGVEGLSKWLDEKKAYQKKIEDLYYNYFKDNIGEFTERLDEELYGRCDGDLKVYYIPNHY